MNKKDVIKELNELGFKPQHCFNQESPMYRLQYNYILFTFNEPTWRFLFKHGKLYYDPTKRNYNWQEVNVDSIANLILLYS